jgi:hypothetical protein
MKNILGIAFAALVVAATGNNGVWAVEKSIENNFYNSFKKNIADMTDGEMADETAKKKNITTEFPDIKKEISKLTVNDKSYKYFSKMMDSLEIIIDNFKSLYWKDVERGLVSNQCSHHHGDHSSVDSSPSATMTPERAALLQDLKNVSKKIKEMFVFFNRTHMNWTNAYGGDTLSSPYPTGCVFSEPEFRPKGGDEPWGYNTVIPIALSLWYEKLRVKAEELKLSPPDHQQFLWKESKIIMLEMSSDKKFLGLSDQIESADTVEDLQVIEFRINSIIDRNKVDTIKLINNVITKKEGENIFKDLSRAFKTYNFETQDGILENIQAKLYSKRSELENRKNLQVFNCIKIVRLGNPQLGTP